MKYELVKTDTKTAPNGTILYRVRYPASCELGGWIESEKNLSQTGNARVSGSARVYGNARVSGDARVSGSAWVYGNARVSGDAWVYDDAQVSGNARVSGDARVSGNAWVSGNARVSGSARVSGDAWVDGDARVPGDARVSGNAWVSGNARVSGDANILTIGPIGSRGATLTVCTDSKLGVRYSTGCFSGSREKFLAKVETEHGDNEHGNAYAAAVLLADHLVKPYTGD